MLTLSRNRPAAARVDFGGGAFAMARPATTPDYERARQQAASLAAGVASTEESLRLFADVAGLEIGVIPQAADMAAAAHSLALMFLACSCIEEIHGVAVGDEVMVAPLRPDQAALLVRDVQIANALEERIFARIAVETEEGNGSTPSRGGAPGADETIAGAAGMPGSHALPGSPASTATAAPRSDIIH